MPKALYWGNDWNTVTSSLLATGVGVAMLSMLAPSSAIAAQATRSSVKSEASNAWVKHPETLLNHFTDQHQLILLAQSDHNYCQAGESLFVATSTRDFMVNICGGDNPTHYVGVEKGKPQNIIRLRLSDSDVNGNFYEAINGEYTYILAKTPRGMFLTVSKGNRELLRQRTLSRW